MAAGMAHEKEQRVQAALPQGKNQELGPKAAEPGPEERKPPRQAMESRPPPAEVPDGLNQLREILIGAALRDLERRVARAEAHMAARAHELEQESRRRMEVIESHMRKESDALTARLERELVQTNEAIRAVTREHRESITAADQRAFKLEESLVRAQRELREQLLQQAKGFLDEIQQFRREVTETLERELGPAETFEQGGYGEVERPTP
jgi:hypothetical protein